MAKLFRAVIMGPPGSGKGTISERIAKSFGLLHLSSGDFLRENIAANTGRAHCQMSPPQFSELMQQCFNSQGINKFRQEAGVLAQTYIERGLLVPDHVITRLLLPRVEQMTSHSWLLDGFPRTMAQAQALNSSCELDVVINLNIPFETLKERLSDRWVHAASGRVYNMGFNPPRVKGKDDISGEPLIQYDDDKPKALVARLRHYKDVAKPVIDLYKEKGILHSFSGTETDKIWPYISSLLSTKIQTQQTDVLRAPIP